MIIGPIGGLLKYLFPFTENESFEYNLSIQTEFLYNKAIGQVCQTTSTLDHVRCPPHDLLQNSCEHWSF
jgi:hypothetical protein